MITNRRRFVRLRRRCRRSRARRRLRMASSPSVTRIKHAQSTSHATRARRVHASIVPPSSPVPPSARLTRSRARYSSLTRARRALGDLPKLSSTPDSCADATRTRMTTRPWRRACVRVRVRVRGRASGARARVDVCGSTAPARPRREVVRGIYRHRYVSIGLCIVCYCCYCRYGVRGNYFSLLFYPAAGGRRCSRSSRSHRSLSRRRSRRRPRRPRPRSRRPRRRRRPDTCRSDKSSRGHTRR